MTIKGKTKSGFEFEVSADYFDDWEVVEQIADYEEQGGVHIMKNIIVDMLGRKQYRSLKEHLRNENGKITTSAMEEAITEIFEAVQQGEAKN